MSSRAVLNYTQAFTTWNNAAVAASDFFDLSPVGELGVLPLLQLRCN